MIKITMLNKTGHETLELTEQEAEDLLHAEFGRYFIVDEETKKPLREIKLEDGQELMLIPISTGG